jgi:hypothetical protein
MTLPGPSRTITVEPVEVPARPDRERVGEPDAPGEEPRPDEEGGPAEEPRPEREPVPAR